MLHGEADPLWVNLGSLPRPPRGSKEGAGNNNNNSDSNDMCTSSNNNNSKVIEIRRRIVVVMIIVVIRSGWEAKIRPYRTYTSISASWMAQCSALIRASRPHDRRNCIRK